LPTILGKGVFLLEIRKEFLEDIGFRSFVLGPVPPYRAPVFFRKDDSEVLNLARLAGGFVTLHDLRGGIAPSCPMEKNDERIRPLVFGVPRGEVQGVDDLIPCDGSLVSEVLLVLALVNIRFGPCYL
jgi:hypothetical protein